MPGHAARRLRGRAPRSTTAPRCCCAPPPVIDRQDEILDLIVLESGKARKHAFDEPTHIALTARYYARTAHAPPRHPAQDRRRAGLTRFKANRVPKGVVGIISPWNYPFTMALSRIDAADLAIGLLRDVDCVAFWRISNGNGPFIIDGTPSGNAVRDVARERLAARVGLALGGALRASHSASKLGFQRWRRLRRRIRGVAGGAAVTLPGAREIRRARSARAAKLAARPERRGDTAINNDERSCMLTASS